MNIKVMKVGLCLATITLILANWIYLLNPFQTALEKGQDAKVKSDISAISMGLMEYEALNGFLPNTSQGVEALVTKPSDDPVPKHWRQSLLERIPVDPWGNAYRYEQPGKHNPNGFDLYTTSEPRGKVRGNW